MGNKKISKYIRERIKERKRQLGLNQTELAKKADITQAALSQIDNGVRTPSLLVLKKLAKALNVNIEELIDEPKYRKPGDKKLHNFYEKYQVLDALSEIDQGIVLKMANRLKK